MVPRPPPLPAAIGRSAFSLVELLVVIAIVSILAGLSMTTMATVRELARGTQCASNLRQIGLAFSVYASDNDSFLPPCQTVYPGESTQLWGMWPWRIDPEVTSFARLNPMYRCPTGTWRWGATPTQVGVWSTNSYGYSLQLWSSVQGTFAKDHYNWPPGPWGGPGRGVLLSRMVSPSMTFLLAERWSLKETGAFDIEVEIQPPNTSAPMDVRTRRPVASNPFGPAGTNTTPGTAMRIAHRQNSNYLMIDGHVEALDFKATMTLNASTPPNRWTGRY
jgi:prepilin-type N-terminal cleavage/methylation domain-containing protein/prepilin-type processing-associated H-X9-DG protein